MKTSILSLLVLFALLNTGITVLSQEIAPFTGDIKVLKNEKTLNVKFSFDKMKVGEYSSEKEYTDHRVKEYDDNKQGKGAEWLAEWNDNKKKWQNTFVKELNKRLKKQKVVASLDQKQANYTLLINPLFWDFGWYAGITSSASELDLEILVFLSDDMENQKARILIENVHAGGGGDWKSKNGIYIKGAQKFAKFLIKNVY